MTRVPIVDLTSWFEGDRVTAPKEVDAALSDVGFLLVTGHGVPVRLRDDIRAAAKRFFALPYETKQPYAVTIGGRGWLPPGAEANGYAEGTPTPPDLKETFAVGADQPMGDPEHDPVWFLGNVYPGEVPELEALVTEYLAQMRRLADELLLICGIAIGRPRVFLDNANHPSYTMNINWYPPLSLLGPPEPGQFRIGPHTDFGTVTILDRQPGVGGLQVFVDGAWADAPYAEDSFTINIGDLLARWTGDRWCSNRHRVLPPDASAPDEELVSLVYFYECNPNAQVESLPVGTAVHSPVRASDYLLEKLRAITV
jgi:isopenicillin N synthase-like dioxygenase